MPIIKDNIDATEQLLADFNAVAEKNQNELLKIVLDRLYDLSVTKGVLNFDSKSSEQINQIIKDIYKDFDFKKYQSEISGLFRNLDDVGKTTIELTALINDNLDNFNFSEKKKFIINELSETIANKDTFKVNIIDDVRRIIAKRILIQSPIKELRDELKLAIAGSDAVGGSVQRYVSQITTDAVMQYKGSINQEIKTKLKLDGYSYIGSIIETSRKQCKRWVEEKNSLLLFEKTDLIETYGLLSEEIEYAQNQGSGYGKKGTSYFIKLTEDNFATVRGGYGCRHEAVPFRISEKSLKRAERMKNDYNSQMEKFKEANPNSLRFAAAR